jgi:hypothetical protein
MKVMVHVWVSNGNKVRSIEQYVAAVLCGTYTIDPSELTTGKALEDQDAPGALKN